MEILPSQALVVADLVEPEQCRQICWFVLAGAGRLEGLVVAWGQAVDEHQALAMWHQDPNFEKTPPMSTSRWRSAPNQSPCGIEVIAVSLRPRNLRMFDSFCDTILQHQNLTARPSNEREILKI